jgi:hypothetical protein
MSWSQSQLSNVVGKPELVHAAYVDELRQLGAHRSARSQNQTDSLYSLGDIGVALRKVRQRWFCGGLGVGLLSMALIGLAGLTTGASASSNDRGSFGAAATVTNDQVTVLRGEVELLRSILAGLVESVEAISHDRRVGAKTGAAELKYPFPIKVTSGKANLRKSPDRQSPSLFEALRDTTLIAFDGTETWFKVNTPRGEDAWISRSVVEPMKE